MTPAVTALCFALIAQPLSYHEVAEIPPRFLQCELLSLGPGVGEGPGRTSPLLAARALKLTYSAGRFRAGISAFDIYFWWLPDENNVTMFAPLRIGYNLVQSPKKTAFFYGLVPSCHTELTVAPYWQTLPLDAPPLYLRLSAGCEVDYFGIGIGGETGVAGLVDWQDGPSFAFFDVSVRLRLLTASFGL